MKIGLLFGSFDPVHNGHMSIARWAIDSGVCQRVWMVLSPQNPLKSNAQADFETRAQMLQWAVEGSKGVEICTVEREMTPPFYTINTIEHLQSENPDSEFTILCGTDIIEQSHKWHRAEELHRMVSFTEYPRYRNDNLPFVEVSSTEIRLGEKHHLLHPKVRDYIAEHRVYNANMERGRQLYNQGEIGGAINQWLQCKGTPQEREAETLIEMAQDILAYRYTEIYNP